MNDMYDDIICPNCKGSKLTLIEKYTEDKFNKQEEDDLVLPDVIMVLVVFILFVIVTYARYKNEKKKYKQEVIIWF